MTPGAQRSPTTPRPTEARLLAGAVAITALAAALLGWSQSSSLPPAAVITTLTLTVVAVVAHLAVRTFAPHADPALLPAAFLLNGLSLVLVRRVDLATGSNLAATQTVWTVVSVGAFCATLLIVRRARDLGRFQYTFGLITLVLLVAPVVPGLTAGVINGAQLWVDVLGMRFQPAEVAKLTMVVFLAGYLERNRALLSVATQRLGPVLVPAPRHLAPVVVAAGLALVILAGLRDLGTAVLFLAAFVTLLYVATGRLAYPLVGGTVFALGGLVAFQSFAHVRSRVGIWLDPWAEITGAGYQLVQSLFAIGTGGLTGTGLGFGRPQDVPFAATDAIFVVIGEELGLLGATAVLLLFLVIVMRGLQIAARARDEFSTLLAVGLTVSFAVQVVVIVGGLTRLVPLTGITLPFVSYGGSSLLANYLLLAVLLRVGDESRAAAVGPARPRPPARPSERRSTQADTTIIRGRR